ncbi:MAG: hypothetical protein JST04_13575 [Bdellovibrionales bacterium]|nr:hypothetical protein [Bdellovibrionales bacterium]
MEKNDLSKRIRQEFLEFANIEKIAVPKGLSETVLGTIRSELNPSSASVFLKLTLIHFFVGFATLSMCPQFGVSLTSSMGLMQYLMKYGEGVCMLGCGALFLGASVLVASFVLKPEEVKVLRRNRVLLLSSLAALSLGILVGVGGEVVATLGLVWVLGAVVGGSGLMQLGWTLRKLAIQGTW